MTRKIESDILKAISLIPGLAGIARIKPDSSNSSLSQSDWIKGVSFEATPSGLFIRIGIIVNVDIKAKIVSKEITSAIKSVIKKSSGNIKIRKIVIYVRGVK